MCVSMYVWCVCVVCTVCALQCVVLHKTCICIWGGGGGGGGGEVCVMLGTIEHWVYGHMLSL